MQGDLARGRLAAGHGDAHRRGVEQPAAGLPAEQRPAGLLDPDGREAVLRARQEPLDEVEVEAAGAAGDDAGVDVAGEAQAALAKQVPGAHRVGVLRVVHEQRAGLGRQLEEAREGAQEEHVRVAVRERLAGRRLGEQRHVEELQRERVGEAESARRGAARQELRQTLVGLAPRENRRLAETRRQPLEIGRRQRPVVVDPQAHRARRAAQQAAQADEGHVDVSVAQERADRPAVRTAAAIAAAGPHGSGFYSPAARAPRAKLGRSASATAL